MSIKKLCVHCKHFDFYGGSHGYSEYTPGSIGSIECAKNMFDGDMDGMTASEYRAIMLTAQNCPHFELADDMNDNP